MFITVSVQASQTLDLSVSFPHSLDGYGRGGCFKRLVVSSMPGPSAPAAAADGEPLHRLNGRSAAAGSWVVRVLHPKVTKFDFGKGGEKITMHQFTCRLVGDNAALYCMWLLTWQRKADA